MNYLEILAIYGVGTIAGIALFHYHIKERMVQATLDSMIEDEYIRTSVDENGEVHLHRWYELEDIIEELQNEKNDTP